MGFTSGFVFVPSLPSISTIANIKSQFSGITLTSSVLYLSLFSHQRARLHQAYLLHQQSLLLTSIIDPEVIPIENAPRYVVKRANWVETWKDRWNSEVEGAVRWVQNVEWRKVREGVEGRWRGWNEGDRRI